MTEIDALTRDTWMLKADDHGHFGIKITKDGTWLHQGDPIGRERLVKLFASVLHKDQQGQHWLVTPAEKGRIDVELAPLFITQLDDSGDTLVVTTSTGEQCTIDAQQPLRMVDDNDGGVLPVVTIRDGLTGLFSRATYYQLMENVVEGPDPDNALGVWSAGRFFRLDRDGDDSGAGSGEDAGSGDNARSGDDAGSGDDARSSEDAGSGDDAAPPKPLSLEE